MNQNDSFESRWMKVNEHDAKYDHEWTWMKMNEQDV